MTEYAVFKAKILTMSSTEIANASLFEILDDIILSGSVKIHPNGLAEYEFEHNGNYASEYADQMHIAIRNIFHRHDHHSSDLPLNTISSNSEQEAIKKIAYQYIQKFIEYKRLSTSAPPLSARDDLYRAKGEIEYATAYIDTNKKNFNDESLEKFNNSLKSFAHSFDILSKRISDKIEWGCNQAVWTLTVFLLAFALVPAREDINAWIPQMILGMTAFSIIFWISISLAIYLLMDTWYCFRTSLEKSQ